MILLELTEHAYGFWQPNRVTDERKILVSDGCGIMLMFCVAGAGNGH